MKYATVRDLSRNPAKILSNRDPVVITRNGNPTKILLPFDDDMLLLNEPKVNASIKKSRLAKSRGNRGKTAEELMSSIRKRKK